MVDRAPESCSCCPCAIAAKSMSEGAHCCPTSVRSHALDVRGDASFVPSRLLNRPSHAMRVQPVPDASRKQERMLSPDDSERSPGAPGTISAQEAARLFGIHARTVRRAIGSGELTATKQRGAFYINNGSNCRPSRALAKETSQD